MRTVVTGGAGFIGSHLVDALVFRGDEVLVIDDLSTGRLENLSRSRSSTVGSVALLKQDLCSPEAAEKIVEFRPDVVFHQAAQANVRRSVQEPAFDAQKNVVGTVNMLEAAHLAQAKAFIFASTGGAIYGEQLEFPAPETHPAFPECQYGVSKHCAELYLEYYARAFGLSCTALRYANVYGPRQNPKGEAGVVAIFAQRLLSGQPLKVNGDGRQTRDFVFVGDVVAANLLASNHIAPRTFAVYNVGTGIESSVLDLIPAFESKWKQDNSLQQKGEFRVEHGPELPGEQRRSVITAQKIKDAFGWTPTVALEDGLRQTIESFLG